MFRTLLKHCFLLVIFINFVPVKVSCSKEILNDVESALAQLAQSPISQKDISLVIKYIEDLQRDHPNIVPTTTTTAKLFPVFVPKSSKRKPFRFFQAPNWFQPLSMFKNRRKNKTQPKFKGEFQTSIKSMDSQFSPDTLTRRSSHDLYSWTAPLINPQNPQYPHHHVHSHHFTHQYNPPVNTIHHQHYPQQIEYQSQALGWDADKMSLLKKIVPFFLMIGVPPAAITAAALNQLLIHLAVIKFLKMTLDIKTLWLLKNIIFPSPVPGMW